MSTKEIESHKINIHIVVIAFGLFFLADLCTEALSASEKPSYLVEAYLDQTDPFLLNLKLKVGGTSTIKIYESDLPWKVRYKIMLVAALADGSGRVAEPILYISDPGPGTITVQPGETLTGSVNLLTRFRNLEQIVRETDVVIFWSYRLAPINDEPLKRVGGWVLVPRQQ